MEEDLQTQFSPQILDQPRISLELKEKSHHQTDDEGNSCV
jgi:hypothetical protein